MEHYARYYEAAHGEHPPDPYLSPEQRAGAEIGDESSADSEQKAGVSLGDDYFNWPDERKARESELEMSDYIRERYGDEVVDQHEQREHPGPQPQPGRVSILNPDDS